MSAFQLPFQKQTPTWSIAVKPRTAGQRLWASSRAIETSDALPSSSSSWAEAVGTGVVIQIKRLWGPSSRDAKPTWKQVHIVILLWGTIPAKMDSQPWVQYYCYVAGGWILLPEQAVNCRQITVHGYQIHPTWILHPFESQVDSQGAFSGITHLQPSDSSKWRGWWMHPKTLPLRAVHYSGQTDPDSPASHLPDGAVKFSFPQ